MDWTLNWTVAVSALALVVAVWSAWFSMRRKQAASVQLQALTELKEAAIEGQRITASLYSIVKLDQLDRIAQKEGEKGFMQALGEASKLINEMAFLYEGVSHCIRPKTRSLLDEKKEYIRRYVDDNDKTISFDDAMLAMLMFPQEVLDAIKAERDDIVDRNR